MTCRLTLKTFEAMWPLAALVPARKQSPVQQLPATSISLQRSAKRIQDCERGCVSPPPVFRMEYGQLEQNLLPPSPWRPQQRRPQRSLPPLGQAQLVDKLSMERIHSNPVPLQDRVKLPPLGLYSARAESFVLGFCGFRRAVFLPFRRSSRSCLRDAQDDIELLNPRHVIRDGRPRRKAPQIRGGLVRRESGRKGLYLL